MFDLISQEVLGIELSGNLGLDLGLFQEILILRKPQNRPKEKQELGKAVRSGSIRLLISSML